VGGAFCTGARTEAGSVGAIDAGGSNQSGFGGEDSRAYHAPDKSGTGAGRRCMLLHEKLGGINLIFRAARGSRTGSRDSLWLQYIKRQQNWWSCISIR
jgi:hypothetical protein